MSSVPLHTYVPLPLAGGLTITRLSLHVLAACIWVGGQFVLGALMPTVRTMGEGAPRTIARAFAKLSWPAYWVLVATGIWNYFAIDHRQASATWNITFGIKMLCVIIAGLAGFLHTRTQIPQRRGLYAGLSAMGSVAALVLGVAIAG